MSKSVFKVWDDLLFTTLRGLHGPSSSSAAATAAGGARGASAASSSLQSFQGDLELVVSGVQENLLRLRYLDVNMAKTSRLADVLLQVRQATNLRGSYAVAV